MGVRTSAAGAILRLITALRHGSPLERDAAVARLTVIGERAVPHLIALLGDGAAQDAAHLAALAVLQSVDDRRALEAALARLSDQRPAIAAAAVGVARRWVAAATETAALDRLTAVALDATCERRVRLAALAALGDLPAGTCAPLWRALAADPDPEIRACRSAEPAGDAGTPAGAAAVDADTPGVVRRWTDAYGATAPLPTLHRLVETVRQREGSERSDARRLAWTAARAELHQVLAARGSRVALYDLRETLEGARAPIAAAFLHASERVGDASLLEPLARLYVAVPGDGWWRDRLVGAAHGIMARERITARHGVMTRIAAKWPAAAAAFRPERAAGSPRTRGLRAGRRA